MAGTLYDLLEISQSASADTVHSAYARIKEKLQAATLDEEDKVNQLKALKEAYRTLSDSVTRARYDQRLAARQSIQAAYVVEKGPWGKIAVLGVLVAACGLGYAKYDASREQAKLERERLIAEQKKAELAAIKMEEEKAAKEARIAAASQKVDEITTSIQLERDRAYASQVSRNIQMQEAQARREEERRQQQAAQAERQRQREYEQKLAKDQALLRQLQYENSGGGRYKY